MTPPRKSRVTRIIEAGRRVDAALDHLSRLPADDPRFEGSHQEYQAALAARAAAECDRPHQRAAKAEGRA